MNKPIELNEYGLAVWKNKKNKNLFAQRSYNWVDRIIVLDESQGQRIIEDTRFSTFDFSEWIPMTLEEYGRVKACFNEIYE